MKSIGKNEIKALIRKKWIVGIRNNIKEYKRFECHKNENTINIYKNWKLKKMHYGTEQELGYYLQLNSYTTK